MKKIWMMLVWALIISTKISAMKEIMVMPLCSKKGYDLLDQKQAQLLFDDLDTLKIVENAAQRYTFSSRTQPQGNALLTGIQLLKEEKIKQINALLKDMDKSSLKDWIIGLSFKSPNDYPGLFLGVITKKYNGLEVKLACNIHSHTTDLAIGIAIEC